MSHFPEKGAGADDYTEITRLRITDAHATDARTRTAPGDTAGAASCVGQTTTITTYPTTAGAFYAMLPVMVTGAETEGTAGTLTVGTGTFLALNLGTAIPPTGTNVVCTLASHRWTFRYD